jgi:ribonuclease BN (tRNA processing enzyme)
MAAEVATQAGVGQLALFHFDPMYDDAAVVEMEKRGKSIFPNSIAAHEGLEIKL